MLPPFHVSDSRSKRTATRRTSEDPQWKSIRGDSAAREADGIAPRAQARRTTRLLLRRIWGGRRATRLRALTNCCRLLRLYIKTKNFHWHVSGRIFAIIICCSMSRRSQIYEATDLIAERARKLGGMTIRSIRHVARLQRLTDNDAEFVAPLDMLAELRDDNSQLTRFMREATASLTNMAMWRRPACSRTGSTRPKPASGTYSGQVASTGALHSVARRG